MFSLPSAIRHFAFKTAHSAGPRDVFYPSASKQNELPFLRGDTVMALFINPCQYPTYGDPLTGKGPTRKKPFCETNLTLGRIGNLGKMPPPPRLFFLQPSAFILLFVRFLTGSESRLPLVHARGVGNEGPEW